MQGPPTTNISAQVTKQQDKHQRARSSISNPRIYVFPNKIHCNSKHQLNNEAEKGPPFSIN
jgi:hypothetical protein